MSADTFNQASAACPGSGKPVFVDYGGPAVFIARCSVCRVIVNAGPGFNAPDHLPKRLQLNGPGERNVTGIAVDNSLILGGSYVEA